MRPLAAFALVVCLGLAAIVQLVNWIDPPQKVVLIDAHRAAAPEVPGGAAPPTQPGGPAPHSFNLPFVLGAELCPLADPGKAERISRT